MIDRYVGFSCAFHFERSFRFVSFGSIRFSFKAFGSDTSDHLGAPSTANERTRINNDSIYLILRRNANTCPLPDAIGELARHTATSRRV